MHDKEAPMSLCNVPELPELLPSLLSDWTVGSTLVWLDCWVDSEGFVCDGKRRGLRYELPGHRVV